MYRAASLLVLLGLAACSGNPRDYGITGPGSTPSLQPDTTLGMPGVPDASTVYGPSLEPTTGSGRFWGYN
jgi:hypothetical protein